MTQELEATPLIRRQRRNGRHRRPRQTHDHRVGPRADPAQGDEHVRPDGRLRLHHLLDHRLVGDGHGRMDRHSHVGARHPHVPGARRHGCGRTREPVARSGRCVHLGDQDDGGDLGLHRRLSVVGAGDSQCRVLARSGAVVPPAGLSCRAGSDDERHPAIGDPVDGSRAGTGETGRQPTDHERGLRHLRDTRPDDFRRRPVVRGEERLGDAVQLVGSDYPELRRCRASFTALCCCTCSAWRPRTTWVRSSSRCARAARG